MNNQEIVQKDPVISVFWRRSLAFVIDLIILGLIGTAVGTAMESQLAMLGESGPLVGFLITVLYFGVLDSHIGHGQSVGNKLFKNCVVNKDGEFITLARSFARAAILGVPICLNVLYLPVLPALIQLIIGLIFFCISVAVIYFYLFNRNTRQGFHDIVTKVFVVKAKRVKEPICSIIGRVHFVICSLLILVVLCGGGYVIYLQHQPANVETMTMLTNLQEDLAKIEGVDTTGVYVGNQVQSNDGNTIQNMNVTVYTHDPKLDLKVMEDNIINIVLVKYPLASHTKEIQVRIFYGYNIGIAKKYQTHVTAFSPANLERRGHAIENTVF